MAIMSTARDGLLFLQCQMEPDSAVYKYAVLIMNKDRAVGFLMNGKAGSFSKIVFFFLRADVSNKATVKINAKGKGTRKKEREWKFNA